MPNSHSNNTLPPSALFELHPVDFAYELNELGFDETLVNPIDAALFLAEHIIKNHGTEEVYATELASGLLTEGFDEMQVDPIQTALTFVEFLIVKDSCL